MLQKVPLASGLMNTGKIAFIPPIQHLFELIKYVYYNNNRVICYRAMRIFIKRYGYELSNTTMHKYMNKELNLCAVIMHSKLGYKTGKKKTTLK